MIQLILVWLSIDILVTEDIRLCSDDLVFAKVAIRLYLHEIYQLVFYLI